MTIYEAEERDILYNAYFRHNFAPSCEYCPAAWCCLQAGKSTEEIDGFECGYQFLIGAEEE